MTVPVLPIRKLHYFNTAQRIGPVPVGVAVDDRYLVAFTLLRTRAEGDRVVAVISAVDGDVMAVRAAVDIVVAGAADEDVIAPAAVQAVIACPTVDIVVALAALDMVIARAADKAVVAFGADHSESVMAIMLIMIVVTIITIIQAI